MEAGSKEEAREKQAGDWFADHHPPTASDEPIAAKLRSRR
jgi:hypothetical protein